MTTTLRIVAACLAGQWFVVAGEPGRMVEIDYQGTKRTGTVIVHQADVGWFLERDGRLEAISLSAVGHYRPLGRFQPWSIVELREQLSREFGPDFRVVSTSHYLVVVPVGRGERLAHLFEELYRQFVVVFSSRGLPIREPRFPLVAVVLPDLAAFQRYCHKEGVQPQPGLRGYYLPSSNRVALCDVPTEGPAASATLDATVIHEATHQVAFNFGIHSRMNADPKWVVEGLATVFEREAVRLNNRRTPVLGRVNPERYARFQQYRQARRPADALRRLISTDIPFEVEPLDAYAEAWALSFYLLERRPAEYASYLRKLSARDPWSDYDAERRLKDFQDVFGRDLAAFEQQFLRYYRELAASAVDD
jgi:hypothetical protein